MFTRTTDLNRFPFSNFKYFLTLFSKFFSSFPHGTCSLSVSRQYLALDGIYHPFRAAFPSNSTRRKRVIDDTCSQRQTGFSPSLIPCSNGLTPGPCRTAASVDYNSPLNLIRGDFQFELFPLHSPLLRESLLVSFPPLSYMLKSSGSSYLISDPELNGVDALLRLLVKACTIKAAIGPLLNNRTGRGGLPKGIPHCQDDSTASPLQTTSSRKLDIHNPTRTMFRKERWGELGLRTLKQACSQGFPEAQLAFKNLMIH